MFYEPGKNVEKILWKNNYSLKLKAESFPSWEILMNFLLFHQNFPARLLIKIVIKNSSHGNVVGLN
jgi:hypothetical protein